MCSFGKIRTRKTCDRRSLLRGKFRTRRAFGGGVNWSRKSEGVFCFSGKRALKCFWRGHGKGCFCSGNSLRFLQGKLPSQAVELFIWWVFDSPQIWQGSCRGEGIIRGMPIGPPLKRGNGEIFKNSNTPHSQFKFLFAFFFSTKRGSCFGPTELAVSLQEPFLAICLQ